MPKYCIKNYAGIITRIAHLKPEEDAIAFFYREKGHFDRALYVWMYNENYESGHWQRIKTGRNK